METSLKELG